MKLILYIVKAKSPSSVFVTIKLSTITFIVSKNPKLEKNHDTAALQNYSPYHQLYVCSVVALNSFTTMRRAGINCLCSTSSQAVGEGESLVYSKIHYVPKTVAVVRCLGCR